MSGMVWWWSTSTISRFNCIAASNQVVARRHERCFRKLDKMFHSGSKANHDFIAHFFERGIQRYDG
jgi:hypothetical protein